ncbi:MAG: hypothetical protein EGQ73_05005 [Clostridiales bacterium]|nr:hypothetical protein [Clostridiales bacterium]MBD8975069.1 hypothetical protein [Clostridiales bacterium]
MQKSRRLDFIILNRRGVGNSLNLMLKYIVMIILTTDFNKFKMKMDIIKQNYIFIIRNGKVFLWI